jgi:type II secretory pathway predicted ATPase ExeA
MYVDFYGLKLKPFENNPDPKFLWFSVKHREALAALTNNIYNNSGMSLLVGDPGTGKTTLINALADRFGRNHFVVRMPDPSLDEPDLYRILADVLPINKKIEKKDDFLDDLNRFVADAYENKRKVVLVIDEAQRLNPELIEPLRYLSNLGKAEKHRVNIIFVGHKDFLDVCEKNEALGRDLVFNPVLEPLTENEIGMYIMHRLSIAGLKQRVFRRAAVREIYAFSEGIPRMINNICDLSLSAGHQKEKKSIDSAIVKACAARYQDKNTYRQKAPVAAKWKIAAMASAAVVIPVMLLGYVHFQNGAPAMSNVEQAHRAPASFKGGRSKNQDKIIMFQDDDTLLRVAAIDAEATAQEQAVQPVKGGLDHAKGADMALDAALKELSMAKDKGITMQNQLAEQAQTLLEYENLINELKAHNKKLSSQLAKNNKTQAQIAALEKELAAKEKMLSHRQQRLIEAKQLLDHERDSKEQLRSAVSSKTTVIKELQVRIKHMESLSGSSKTSTHVVREPQGQIARDYTLERKIRQPDPGAIIEWVIKKKSAQ